MPHVSHYPQNENQSGYFDIRLMAIFAAVATAERSAAFVSLPPPQNVNPEEVLRKLQHM